jgi:hypothetical protein
MSTSDHQRGDRKGVFCDVPSEKKCDDCTCTKNYIEICEPAWKNMVFPRMYNTKYGVVKFKKKYEAHHVVCVEPVLSEILGRAKIQGIIHATKWCVNNGDNMLAMPLWGHTVMWYCAVTSVSGAIKGTLVAPLFQNICNHDRDHRAYSLEITADLKKMADGVEAAGHQAKSEPIQQYLNGLSAKWKAQLAARAMRRDGTHQGFLDGKASKKDWYQPFSMASDAKVTDVGFPVKNFNDMVARWIDKIKTAIAGGA